LILARRKSDYRGQEKAERGKFQKKERRERNLTRSNAVKKEGSKSINIQKEKRTKSGYKRTEKERDNKKK